MTAISRPTRIFSNGALVSWPDFTSNASVWVSTKPGPRAAIILRFYPEATVVGEVHALFPRLGGEEGARFVAHIRLVDTGGLDLLPGLTGRAEIALE